MNVDNIEMQPVNHKVQQYVGIPQFITLTLILTLIVFIILFGLLAMAILFFCN